MSRPCTICIHPDRAAIEAAILDNAELRGIARTFDLSEDALSRHKRGCIKKAVESIQQKQTEQTAHVVAESEQRQARFVWDIFTQMEWLHRQVRLVYEEARAEGDHGSSLKALSEARQQTKLFSELLAGQEQGSRAQLEEEWLNVREVIFEALEPFPEAKRAVARALLALGRGEHDTVLPGEQLGETS